MGRPVRAVGPKVGAARGVSRLRSKVTKSFAIPPPFARFFCIGPRWFAVLRGLFPVAPREVEKLRVFRLRPPVFSSFARAFFVRRPGRPLRGVKCAVSRAYVSRPRQPLFVFSLHRFTHPDNMLTHKQLCVKTSPFCLHPCLPPLPPRARRPDRGVKTAAK